MATSLLIRFAPFRMKMQAMQSAMAVRRQRTRWEEQKKDKLRRASRDTLSTPRDSIVSLEGKVYFNQKTENKSMFGQVTMFHVGIVFIVIGLMLVITALMPGYVENNSEKRKNDILGTGSVFVFIGGILTTVSRFISNNEERELNEYIHSRLARSKSGHKVLKESSGFPTPKRDRKLKPNQNGVSSSSLNSDTNSSHVGTGGHSSAKRENSSSSVGGMSNDNIPPLKPHTSPSHESSTETKIDIPISPSEEAILSKILEEDEIELEDRTDCEFSTEPLDSTPDLSLTSASPFETQVLLERHTPRRVSKTSSKSSFKSTT